jgi:hypothetical protein
MPNPDIDPVKVTQFSDMIHVAAQQTQSRLKPYMKLRTFDKGEDMAYDSIGQVTGQIQNTRFQPIVHSAPVWGRRKIGKDRFYCAIPIDDLDKLDAICDPQSEYHTVAAAELRRFMDRISIAAAFADVLTGKNFGTTVDATTDGVLEVDATAGLTYEKLLEADENFIDNEIGNEAPAKKLICITGQEHTALMKETELTSGDFSRQYSIEKGVMQSALGFDLLKFGGRGGSPMIEVNEDDERLCPVISEGGICVGIQREFFVEVEKRTDLLNTWQLVISSIAGAVRTEGKRVQLLKTTAA